MHTDNILKYKSLFCKGDFKMYAQGANVRPAYTDNEISLMFREKRNKEHKELSEIAATLDKNIELVEFVDEGNCSLSSEMLEVASLYLDIPYEKLTAITYDESEFSCRGQVSEEADDLFDMVNILFHQMILQQKLAK